MKTFSSKTKTPIIKENFSREPIYKYNSEPKDSRGKPTTHQNISEHNK